MQKCPKCLAEQNNLNSNACFYCGADMGDSATIKQTTDSAYDKDDYIPEKNISLPDSDDLGVETTAELMESEAHSLDNDVTRLEKEKVQQDTSAQNISNQNPNNIKKLSDREIKDIENNLYKSENYINNQEKSDLINKINSLDYSKSNPAPFSNTLIDPHKNTKKQVKNKSERPKPQAAQKSQGIAYFYNSYIQIQGSQKLHNDDLLSIDKREYILKQKNFNKNVALYSIGAFVVLIVAVIGSFLAGNSNFGNGQVFGLILDQNNNPYIEGATVIFTELGEKSTSDSQGLFSFASIPAGSHKIEYFTNGEKTGIDYITIADNNNSFITLSPNIEEPVQANNQIVKPALAVVASKQKQVDKVATQKKQTTTKKKTSSQKTSTKKATTKKSSSKKSTSGYGNLILNANVDGAKFKVDGNVLGAGNLKYSKIKSGKHSYTVSLDGYETFSGSFTIQKGKTQNISPTLKALTQIKKEKTYKVSDYYYSAQNAFKQGDYKTAISDYKKVIEETPNNVNAYKGIAKSYKKLKNWEFAYNNYIIAAEIQQFKGRNNDAITSYNNAININDKLLNAYLGRADIYLSTGEYRAAFGDYDKVVKIDKRNFDGYYGLGETSFKLLRYSKAVKYFKDARSIDKDNPLVHQYLTLAYMYDHDRKNSKKSFEKFNQYASETEKNKFQESSQYSAVTKYIESE